MIENSNGHLLLNELFIYCPAPITSLKKFSGSILLAAPVGQLYTHAIKGYPLHISHFTGFLLGLRFLTGAISVSVSSFAGFFR